MMNHVLLHSFSNPDESGLLFDVAALMAASPLRACRFP
jgi:hypothetical protein